MMSVGQQHKLGIVHWFPQTKVVESCEATLLERVAKRVAEDYYTEKVAKTLTPTPLNISTSSGSLHFGCWVLLRRIPYCPRPFPSP